MVERLPPGAPLPGSPLPGALVRHPDRPDWGIGQVQSVIGNRITVNFENAGKLLIKGDVVSLETVGPDEDV
ncbi:DUF3553 domain-containing protein [Rhodospirillaceae bacterium SYSU D60014]|uniref:DUF3553 domain-containing protein n=1 Tax=Virgifigura deserti TaxID=2268457 RepID=UPI000E65F1B0